MQTMVQIEFVNVTENKIEVNVLDMDRNVVEGSVSFADVVDDAKYVVFSSIHLSRVGRISSFKGLDQLSDELGSARRELSTLRNELATSRGERYQELNASDGPIRNLERKAELLRTAFLHVIKALTGVWPYQFREEFGI